MAFTLAVAVKGGVGKTSVSALLVKYFIEEKKGITLAIDADPNSNLNEKLGVEVEKTVGSLREGLARSIESASRVSKA